MVSFDRASPLVAEALKVVSRLHAAGQQTLFAGGCVRDCLLDRPIKDIDIATSAVPEVIEAAFAGQTYAVGRAFGVIVVRMGGFNFEVATFRADGDYRDGRHPESVRYADAAADAQRRDFTVNGLFFDPIRGQLLDFVQGQRDLKDKCIRAIGDPRARFAEDRLRLLRAVRFASVLGFTLDPATAEAIRACAAEGLGQVSAERIAQEFTRMLVESPKPSVALELLDQLGLLRQFMPEVAALRGVPQPPEFHPEGDVWTHTLMMLDRMPAGREAHLAYGVLLHDVGKAQTTCIKKDCHGNPVVRSPNHVTVGAAIAQDVLARLKQPVALRETVEALVRRHMTFSELPNMRPSTLRRFLGATTFPLDLVLHRLDVACSSGDVSMLRYAEAKLAEFTSEAVLPKSWVMGRDLLEMGMTPNPDIGRWVMRAYDYQLDGRIASRQELLVHICQEWKAGVTPDRLESVPAPEGTR
jgi:poly(A) polymerase